MSKSIDLTGQKFGRLLVIKRAENNKEGKATWLCRCDCGNERKVMGKSLRSGHTMSCGCLNRNRTSESSLIDRTGCVYGRLTVLERGSDYVSPKGKHHVMWKCRCNCGNIIYVDSNDLQKGHTKSCGCYKAEVASVVHTKHSGRQDRLYHVYSNMKNRCYNSNSRDYIYYGGRGISICGDWLNDYGAFKKWAYDNGYNDNAKFGECTIDRINVNGNYEPENCRWVSMKTQSMNRRNVINKNDNSPRKDNIRA